MAKATQLLDHNTPSAPTLALGAFLGASGVTHPPLQTLGVLTGTSSADGSFSDTNGYGHIDYDTAGYLYVADTGNNRVQRFAKNASGVWAFESKLTGVTTQLGGGTNPTNIAIDRSTTPNQIHVCAYDYYTASNWISVWSLANWPTLTVGNRLRQYGANNSSNTAGRAQVGMGLTVDGTVAVVTSYGSPYRLLRWNHTTGLLLNEETQSAAYGQFATDGSGNWWVAGWPGASEAGVYKIDVTTFTGITRLDTTAGAIVSPRPAKLYLSSAYGCHHYSDKIYAKDGLNRMHGFGSGGGYLDDYLLGGGLGAGSVPSGALGGHQNSEALSRKSQIIVDADGCAWFVAWSNNADNTATQCFLTLWPLSTPTVTWSKTDWSAGANTLQSLAIQGTNLSGEKFKIRIRKNAGSWVTVHSHQLLGAAFTTAISGLGTFTDGDTATFELSLSTWDRLDGHSTLTATRDKLSPANVSLMVGYNDDVGDVYVPYASAGFKGKVGGVGAFKGKVGG